MEDSPNRAKIKIALRYDRSAQAGGVGVPTNIALPYRVLDADGTILASGAVSTGESAVLDFPYPDQVAYVRLTWPSGKAKTEKVLLDPNRVAEVVFKDDSISHNEWSAWAIPRLGRNTPLADQATNPRAATLDRLQGVWVRMWNRLERTWAVPPMPDVRGSENPWVKQIDFDLPQGSWCLQVGGENVPSRFVSLPWGRCRVLLAPNESSDPRADPLRVVVSSFRNDAEVLLEFLVRDSLRAADAMGQYNMARNALAEKVDDPVSAAAAGYFLLRTQWERIPDQWWVNLDHLFPWMADGALIYCIVKLRHLKNEYDFRQAGQLFDEALYRGYPLFSEGISLLQEAASLLLPEGVGKPDSHKLVERLVVSSAWAGSALSFYGIHPGEPDPRRIVGRALSENLEVARTDLQNLTPLPDSRPRSSQTYSAPWASFPTRDATYLQEITHEGVSAPQDADATTDEIATPG